MKIISCLGNPGKKYGKTRHNIGFIIGEMIAREYNIKINQKSFSSLYGTGKIEGVETMLLLPQTFMNNSGQAVQSAVNYHKESYSNVIVIHDEIELPYGVIKEKTGGGHKGHNGLRSIIQHSSTPDFHRIRYGVGRPEDPRFSVADYVLANFTKEELFHIEENFKEVLDITLPIIEKD